MADKKIEIKIAATGGDQAAAEVKKVDAAVQSETVTIEKLQTELKEATVEYRKAAIGSAEFEAASKKVTAAQTALAAAGNKVSGSLNFKSQFSNVGFQVQDFAVQMGAGTSALQAFSQQAPQLLSAAGPIGIALGTVAAIGGPLAGVLLAGGKAAEDASAGFDELAKSRQKLQDQKALETQEKWIKSLDDEEAAISLQNAALAENLRLYAALLAAKAKTDDAEFDARDAAIDADQSLSPADRAKAKGGLKQERLTRAREYEVANDNLKISTDEAAAKKERETANRAAADEASARARLAAQNDEAESLRGRIFAANNAKSGVASTQKAIDANSTARRQAQAAAADDGGAFIDSAAFDKEEKRLKEQLAQQELAAGAVSAKDRGRLEELKGKDNRSGTTAELEKQIKALAEAAEKLATAASEQEIKAAGTRKVIEQTAGFRDRTFAARATENATRTNASVRAAEAAAAQKSNDEKRDAAEQERLSQDKAAGALGKRTEKLLPKGVTDEFRKKLQAASTRLQDGDQGGELKQLAALVDQLAASKNSQAGGIASELTSIRKSIADLERHNKMTRRIISEL